MDPDCVRAVEDYSAETILALSAVLDRSTTREHLVYREAELDDLWRIIDTALTASRRDSRAAALSERLQRLLALTIEAHDLVGSAELPREAAARLRTALDGLKA